MPNGGEVTMYLAELNAKLEDATDEGLTAVAFAIIAEAQPNMRVDTGFMVNSGFVVSRLTNTYGAAAAAARSMNPDAIMGPQPPLGEARALVGFGASYTIYVEADYPAIYPAAVRVAGRADSILDPHFRSRL